MTALPKYQTPKCQTVEYIAWRNMRKLCSNPSHPGWERYGGRGIRVCERWDSFDAFFADVGRRPGRGYWLSRLDVDGHYEPGNVKWLHRVLTVRKRVFPHSRMLAYRGKKFPMGQLAFNHGMAGSTLRWRLDNGWDLERALTAPVRQSGNKND